MNGRDFRMNNRSQERILLFLSLLFFFFFKQFLSSLLVKYQPKKQTSPTAKNNSYSLCSWTISKELHYVPQTNSICRTITIGWKPHTEHLESWILTQTQISMILIIVIFILIFSQFPFNSPATNLHHRLRLTAQDFRIQWLLLILLLSP